MSRDNINYPPGMALDADAVCAQCGTVNPEGTLICKVCGNNLRDQRTLRMQSEQSLESAVEPPAARRWLAGALTVIGSLVILFVAVNVDSIVGYAVSGEVGAFSIVDLWSGPQAGVFETLKAEIEANPASPESIQAAIDAAAVAQEGEYASVMEGTWVLYPENPALDAAPLGTARLKLEGAEYAFVAVLEGGAEFRGWATERQPGLLTADVTRAAALQDSQYLPVYGYAQIEATGSASGWGQFQDAAEANLIGFVAYRLP